MALGRWEWPEQFTAVTSTQRAYCALGREAGASDMVPLLKGCGLGGEKRVCPQKCELQPRELVGSAVWLYGDFRARGSAPNSGERFLVEAAQPLCLRVCCILSRLLCMATADLAEPEPSDVCPKSSGLPHLPPGHIWLLCSWRTTDPPL